MKFPTERPTLAEAAIGVALAVAVALPIGIAFRPEAARPATCTGTPDAVNPDLRDICQVGSIRNT